MLLVVELESVVEVVHADGEVFDGGHEDGLFEVGAVDLVDEFLGLVGSLLHLLFYLVEHLVHHVYLFLQAIIRLKNQLTIRF